MFGGVLSLLSAVLFASASVSMRRGVLTGSVIKAVAISLPLALPFFAAVMLLTGGFQRLTEFSLSSIALLSIAGIVHFAFARYCNYRATQAMGANLVAPVQQLSLIITLALAVGWLGETLTALRLIGIFLVAVGPVLMLAPYRRSGQQLASAEPFRPNLTEGYLYAVLSSLGFGISPILIRMAFNVRNIAAGVAGGFISYVAATIVVILLLLVPRQSEFGDSVRLDTESTKWFVIAGLAVCFSQMLRYMALAIAPVSVVTPIQRLSLVFRVYFGRIVNPHHEMFDPRVILATTISLVGAVALTISTNKIEHLIPMPAFMASFVSWHWP